MDRAERNGLGLALVGHVALFAALSLSLLKPPKLPVIENDPIEVDLVTKMAEETTAPDPQPTPPAAAKAEEPAPPEPEALPQVEPVPPVPKPAPRPEPKPIPKPQPKPVPKPAPKPAPKPQPKPTAAKPQPKPKPTPAKPAPKPTKPVAPTGNITGILGGPSPKPGTSPSPKPVAPKPGPTAANAAAIKAALGKEIGRQLKPRWKAPTGADVDQLVTILSWDLNPDGTLSGAPRFISQAGVTPSNQAQATLHRDNAIRAVRAASPFTLPQEHYALWKSVVTFRFDKRLSQ
jgi:outer membrane biosynthesis protein TonB